MQNLQTLIDLGFQKNLHGEYFWRGAKSILVADVIECNGPHPYIQLYLVSDKVDERPHSTTKGRHFKSLIKDCCSAGSVERAIKKYGV
jgi:hypothetical protein